MTLAADPTVVQLDPASLLGLVAPLLALVFLLSALLVLALRGR